MMNKKLTLVVAGLFLCLAGTIILKPSLIEIKSLHDNFKFLETEHFQIKYPESLEQVVNVTKQGAEKKIKEYEEFFGISINDKIKVNYFDDIEKFRKFVYKDKPFPEYSKGTYSDGLFNFYVDPSSQMTRVYDVNHELFHMLYMKHILKKDMSKRFIWYDEGMAQFMSGEKIYLTDENKFLTFYSWVKENTKTIPNLTDLQHGKEFVNENYNGYALSYLSIRYLHETLSPEEFKALMSDFEKIKTIGNDVVEKTFKYYDEKLGVSNQTNN